MALSGAKRRGPTAGRLGAGKTPESPPEARRLRRALLPLRLFLGGTFLYAGLDKLVDPRFLTATGPGSVGGQLQAFLYSSPLAPVVRIFALPMPVAVGATIALAEIAIGIGAITGILFRTSASGGLTLSVLFWLTASWSTQPFYYGADLPFAAGWLTLVLTGPGASSLAERLEQFLPVRTAEPARTGEVMNRRDALRLALQVAILGLTSSAVGAAAWLATGGPARRPARVRSGATAGPSPTAGTAASAGPLASAQASVAGSSPGGLATPSAIASATGPVQVAFLADVQPHEAFAITDPATGDPAFLFRLASGRIVCYDALCTHEACPVDFDPHAELLVCPCHGAVFDPAHDGRVLAGPTREPLPELPLTIDPVTGAITMSG